MKTNFNRMIDDSIPPFGEDEPKEGTISLSTVNTEEEFDMLLTHVLGDDGGGADD